MTEFCICGSLILADHCTNKNCSVKLSKSDQPKTTRKKSVASKNKEAKSTRTKRSSKCITYNLYDTPQDEENVN